VQWSLSVYRRAVDHKDILCAPESVKELVKTGSINVRERRKYSVQVNTNCIHWGLRESNFVDKMCRRHFYTLKKSMRDKTVRRRWARDVECGTEISAVVAFSELTTLTV